MLDTPAERNALLASLLGHHSGFVARQSRGDEDDLQDLLLKLLGSSPDFLVPELAGYEIGVIDAKIEALKDDLARPSRRSQKKTDELYAKLGRLYQERDHITAGPWVRTVLYRMAIDRYRTENNRERILREREAELRDVYGWHDDHGMSEDPARIVIRKLDDEDVRRRILRLPPKLAQVASMRYAGHSYSEIADILGTSADAVWKRAERIRSPKIRAVLGL